VGPKRLFFGNLINTRYLRRNGLEKMNMEELFMENDFSVNAEPFLKMAANVSENLIFSYI
jgi:hypothetical protein